MKQDRRVKKTMKSLRVAITELLMEKDLKDITVSELSERADINRGTFYLHYRDAYDLFESLEAEVLERFKGIIIRHRGIGLSNISPILNELFEYIRQNSEIFKAILRTKETTFLTEVISMAKPRNEEEWKILFKGNVPKNHEYYFTFITYGCIALIKAWFDNGMSESAETMAEMTEKLMSRSLS